MIADRAAPLCCASQQHKGVAVPIFPEAQAWASDVGSALDFALPSWASDVGVVGILLFFGIGLARGWFYTSGQVNNLLSQYDKVIALYEKVAAERQESIKLLSGNTEPILKGNEAILRAVEELQHQQEQARQYRAWQRNQPESDWRP